MPIVKTGFAALACLLGFASIGAKADVVFCNKSSYGVIYVAIAYPQSDGSFLSRGWMSVDKDNCDTFDTALRVKSLYFRGESQWIRHGRRRTREIWGKGRAFAVWDNDNFQYYNAQERVLKSTLMEFTLAGEVADGELAATVSFTDQGSYVEVKTPRPSQPAQDNPAPSTENTPAPSPPQQQQQEQSQSPPQQTTAPATPPAAPPAPSADPDRMNDRFH